MKRCRGCHELKPLDEYHLNSIAPDGHRPRCKKCTNSALRRRYRLEYEYREQKLAICRAYHHRKKAEKAA